LIGEVAKEAEHCIRAFVEQQKGEVVELNVQIDHVHLLVLVPPKVSISNFVGTLKGSNSDPCVQQVSESEAKTLLG
jgi:putative transposase